MTQILFSKIFKAVFLMAYFTFLRILNVAPHAVGASLNKPVHTIVFYNVIPFYLPRAFKGYYIHNKVSDTKVGNSFVIVFTLQIP